MNRLSRIVCALLIALCVAGTASAQSTITQQVALVDDLLPMTAGVFKEQMNTAMNELTSNDIPNIVSTLNIVVTGAVSKVSEDYLVGSLTSPGAISATGTAGTVSAAAGLTVTEDVDIDFDATDEEVDITSVTNGTLIKLNNTAAELTAQTYAIDVTYTDDGDTDGDFLRFRDNAVDEVFTVEENGDLDTAGSINAAGTIAAEAAMTVGTTLGVSGATTLTNLNLNGDTVIVLNLPTSTNGFTTSGRAWLNSGAFSVWTP